jgi:hypothetical protein
VNFEWNRSEVLALAKETCSHCRGFGLRKSSRTGAEVPCTCVFRTVFRACYRRFRYCASQEKHISHARLEQTNGKEGRHSWGMKDEEYMADFCLVSKRTLDPVHFQIFRFHYLLGADWKLCCRRLNMDRGTFFHTVYEIQAKLGRVFRELTPFSLFPLDEYFGGTVRKELPGVNRVVLMPVGRKRRRLNPPVLKAA